jgi:hypothetical protein
LPVHLILFEVLCKKFNSNLLMNSKSTGSTKCWVNPLNSKWMKRMNEVSYIRIYAKGR